MTQTGIDTLIVSDIHLGSEVSRANDALHLLQSLSYQRLILLGDIFSDLNFRRLNGNHWKFLSYIRKLSNRKRGVEVVWVEGNHDHGLSQLMSHLVGVPVYSRYVWQYNGFRHLAVHGHQFDRFTLNNKSLTRFGEAAYYVIQNIEGRAKRFSRYLDRLNTRWLDLSNRVSRGALSYAKQGGADRVFCGHTHVALHAEKDGVHYYNSGSWVDSRCTYLTVDPEGVNIRDYEGRANDCDSREERDPLPAAPAGVFDETGLPALTLLRKYTLLMRVRRTERPRRRSRFSIGLTSR